MMNTTQTRIQIFFAILVWCAGGLTSVRAQSFWNDLTISVEFAAAQHDKRFVSEKLLNQHPEKWGTWQYGISLYKPILDWNYIRLEAGLGYGIEHLTYFRRVDHCFGSPICFDDLVHNDNYKIHLAQTPVKASVRLTRNLEAEMTLLSQFDFYKELIGKRGSRGKTTIDFYSIEVNPGLSYQFDRILIQMNYRLYQVKKIDQTIFSSRLLDEGKLRSFLNEKFEDYNPLKFWFSVGYRLGNAE